MTTEQTQATAAEIRQAVAFGKQAVIRELADLVAKARREARSSRRAPSIIRSGAQARAYRAGVDAGLAAAAGLISAHLIEGEPRR